MKQKKSRKVAKARPSVSAPDSQMPQNRPPISEPDAHKICRDFMTKAQALEAAMRKFKLELEQSKLEQSKLEQSKLEQNNLEQNNLEQNNLEQKKDFDAPAGVSELLERAERAALLKSAEAPSSRVSAQTELDSEQISAEEARLLIEKAGLQARIRLFEMWDERMKSKASETPEEQDIISAIQIAQHFLEKLKVAKDTGTLVEIDEAGAQADGAVLYAQILLQRVRKGRHAVQANDATPVPRAQLWTHRIMEEVKAEQAAIEAQKEVERLAAEKRRASSEFQGIYENAFEIGEKVAQIQKEDYAVITGAAPQKKKIKKRSLGNVLATLTNEEDDEKAANAKWITRMGAKERFEYLSKLERDRKAFIERMTGEPTLEEIQETDRAKIQREAMLEAACARLKATEDCEGLQQNDKDGVKDEEADS